MEDVSKYLQIWKVFSSYCRAGERSCLVAKSSWPKPQLDWRALRLNARSWSPRYCLVSCLGHYEKHGILLVACSSSHEILEKVLDCCLESYEGKRVFRGMITPVFCCRLWLGQTLSEKNMLALDALRSGVNAVCWLLCPAMFLLCVATPQSSLWSKNVFLCSKFWHLRLPNITPAIALTVAAVWPCRHAVWHAWLNGQLLTKLLLKPFWTVIFSVSGFCLWLVALYQFIRWKILLHHHFLEKSCCFWPLHVVPTAVAHQSCEVEICDSRLRTSYLTWDPKALCCCALSAIYGAPAFWKHLFVGFCVPTTMLQFYLPYQLNLWTFEKQFPLSDSLYIYILPLIAVVYLIMKISLCQAIWD